MSGPAGGGRGRLTPVPVAPHNTSRGQNSDRRDWRAVRSLRRPAPLLSSPNSPPGRARSSGVGGPKASVVLQWCHAFAQDGTRRRGPSTKWRSCLSPYVLLGARCLIKLVTVTAHQNNFGAAGAEWQSFTPGVKGRKEDPGARL